METFGEIVVAGLVILLVGTGLYYAVDYSLKDFHGAPLAAVGASQAPTAPVVVAADSTSTPILVAVNPAQFSEVGTIIYYVQQGVEVPYLAYVQGGTTYSKALEFTSETICVTAVQSPCPGTIDALKKTYGSGPVDVQGTPDEESLIISRIALAPA